MKRYIRYSIILFLYSMSLMAEADAWPWAKVKYAHYADNEPIQELLQQFASSINAPITVSDKVSGGVSGNFEETTAIEFLNTISKIHSLMWYFDGQVIYVYDSGEVETALVNMGTASPQRLMNALSRLGVLDKRFRIKTSRNEGIVMVSGPPRYTQLVQEVAEMILEGGTLAGSAPEDKFVVRIFKLKYAWADDREVSMNGQVVRSPGVASTLRAVLGRDTDSGTESVQRQTVAIPGLKGKGLAQLSEARSSGSSATDSGHSGGGPVEGSAAYITSNDRMNAVIVHDRKSRMPLYEELINSLDLPQSQVQIEVSVIDISTDKLDEIGVEWQVNGSNGSVATGDFSDGALPRDTNEISLIVGDNANFSTVLNSTQDLFLARVRALSEKGDASVLSQPTIVTLDNNEAILDNSSTFFVRIAGESEVDLFPVSVGSVVRVTPHIISSADNNLIHMDIRIEDGQQNNQTVDEIPTITKSTISTKALIGENGSLLIGGYYFNQDSSNSRKVPFLGDIPVLGYLFRTDGKAFRKQARLFLISPKVIPTSNYEKLSEIALNHIGEAEEKYIRGNKPRFRGNDNLLRLIGK